MLDLIYTSTKIFSPEFNLLYIQYIKAWDAFVAYGTVPTALGWTLYKLFRDGTLLNIGYCVGSYGVPGSMPNGLHFWKSPSSNWPGRFRRGDDVTGLFSYKDTIMDLIPDDYEHTQDGAAQFIDYPQDRYVMVTNGAYLQVYSLSSGTELFSLFVSAFFTFPYPPIFITWVGANKVAVIQGGTGKFVIFDYMSLTYTPINTVDPCIAASYDTSNGIITTVGTDRKIRLYPLVATPTELSAPEFDPFADTITCQRGYPVKTRLLDASGNPCVGWVVRWDAPNIGFLDKQTSKTDAAGYAWNFYYGSLDTIGAETLTVRTFVP